ncbi:MAG: hypothetical protein KA149_00455 [Chitinophagales bacterium]|nr:hypothetical protein [Chitinophagales bacterium]
MKTMLNLSLLLMLIAGSAGAIDFYKLYNKGEISTLYEKKAVPVVHKAAYKEALPAITAAIVAPPPPPPISLNGIELDTKYFSRSEEIYIVEELQEPEPITEAEEVSQPDSIPAEASPTTITAPEVYQVAVADYTNEIVATDSLPK